jgi:MFS transporter, AAHS family, 4-hydroxybenzoate transporter
MSPKTYEITSVVDGAKFFGLPLAITVLMIFIMLVDGYDLQTMSFVAPVLVSEWGVDRSVISYYVLSASMVGMAIGSIGLGWLGDRIGRRKAYIVCIAFLFIGSLLSAYSNNVEQIVTWRLVTGIGLGGVTPLCATLVSEWTPKHARSVAVACAVVAVPLGGMLGAMVAQWVIPTYGWRMIFFIGAALPLFFFVVAWFLLPESPRFLAQHPDKRPELVGLLNRLFREKRFDGTETFTVAEIEKPPGNWFVTLLRPPFLGTTLLLWSAFLFNTLALYAFVNLLPTVLTSTGISLDSALEGSKLFNFGGFFGAVGGAVLIGFIGSRLVGAGLSTIGAIATVRPTAGPDLDRRHGAERHAVLPVHRGGAFLSDIHPCLRCRLRTDGVPHRRCAELGGRRGLLRHPAPAAGQRVLLRGRRRDPRRRGELLLDADSHPGQARRRRRGPRPGPAEGPGPIGKSHTSASLPGWRMVLVGGLRSWRYPAR